MKDWFPLTSYDFYAYLTAGMVLIAGADYAFGGGSLVARSNWNVPSVVFWTAIAYVVGQVAAGPSALLLEHWLTRKVLPPPAHVILGLKKPWIGVRAFTAIAGAREYGMLAPVVCASIISSCRDILSMPSGPFDPDLAFDALYMKARGNEASAKRMETFLNLYGMSRNVSFSLLCASLFITVSDFMAHSREKHLLAYSTAVIAALMYGRFLKFYSAYTREVLRSAAK